MGEIREPQPVPSSSGIARAFSTKVDIFVPHQDRQLGFGCNMEQLLRAAVEKIGFLFEIE
jgi:hypothetical protein